MPHMKNVGFCENKCIFVFLNTTDNNFGKQKQYGIKEWGIPNE